MDMTVFSVDPSILNIENVILKGANGVYYNLWIKHFIKNLPMVDQKKMTYLFEPGNKFRTEFALCGNGGIESFIDMELLEDQKREMSNFWYIGNWLLDTKNPYLVTLDSNKNRGYENEIITMFIGCGKDGNAPSAIAFTGIKDLLSQGKDDVFTGIYLLAEGKEYFSFRNLPVRGELVFLPFNRVDIFKRIYSEELLYLVTNDSNGEKLFFTFDLSEKEALRMVLNNCKIEYY